MPGDRDEARMKPKAACQVQSPGDVPSGASDWILGGTQPRPAHACPAPGQTHHTREKVVRSIARAAQSRSGQGLKPPHHSISRLEPDPQRVWWEEWRGPSAEFPNGRVQRLDCSGERRQAVSCGAWRVQVTERRREAVTPDVNLLQPGRGFVRPGPGKAGGGGSLAVARMKEKNTGSELESCFVPFEAGSCVLFSKTLPPLDPLRPGCAVPESVCGRDRTRGVECSRGLHPSRPLRKLVSRGRP